jgi:peroxiredoxin
VACLKLANLLRFRADALRKMRSPEPEPFVMLEELARAGGCAPVKRPDEDPDALTREAVQFYERVVERYADVGGKDGKLGEVAAQALFQLRDLAVGKPAPEVEGPDVDSKPLKLSDYRGRVVVLTFAVDIPGPCRDAYPHYRASIERMKGRPYAILSVYLGEDERTLRHSISSGEITWRCWWEGGEQRPNADRWRVGFIPSVYVIDPDAVIRAKDVKGRALDAAVDALMAKVSRPAVAGSRSNP